MFVASVAPPSLEAFRSSYEVVRSSLLIAISKRQPFSLVRIGDGESVILGYREGVVNLDLEGHLRLWFGVNSLAPELMRHLRRRLYSSSIRASILGVPTLRQCGLHPRYQSSYNLLQRRLHPRWGMPLLCDAAVHRFLHLSGDLVALLRQSPFLGIVSSRVVLQSVFSLFQPDQLSFFRAPDENPVQVSANDVSSRLWFPDLFKLIENQLQPPYKGAPYLIGAGLVGKLFCETIRARGGIAIDIGSIFDGWASVPSRDYFSRYPESAYGLQAIQDASFLSSSERMTRLCAVLQCHESDPSSFKLVESSGCGT